MYDRSKFTMSFQFLHPKHFVDRSEIELNDGSDCAQYDLLKLPNLTIFCGYSQKISNDHSSLKSCENHC